MMKEWTIRYSHTPPPEDDVFFCEAETEEEAMEKFETATADSEDVEVQKVTSKDWVDPRQLKLFEQERAQHG